VRLGTREATREFLAFGGEKPRAGKMEGRALRVLRTGVAALRPPLAPRHTQDVPNGARSVEATVSAATGGGGAGDTPATTVRLDRTEGGSASPENASPVEDSPWRARTDGQTKRRRRKLQAAKPRSICQRVEESPRRPFHLGSAPKSRLPLGGADLAGIAISALEVSQKKARVSPFQQITFSSII
jgi:hypothetical protein